MGNLKYWDSATSSWKITGAGATGPTDPILNSLTLTNPLTPSNGGTGISSLAGYGNKALIVNGNETGFFADNIVQVMDNGTFNIVNTSAITDAVNYASIQGNEGEYYRIVLDGLYLNNSGNTRTLALGVYFDGTVVHTGTTPSLSASASFRPFRMETVIYFETASVQRISSHASLAATPVGAAVATWSTADYNYLGDRATTVDTSTAKTLKISFTHSSANANLSIVGSYRIEKLKQFGIMIPF